MKKKTLSRLFAVGMVLLGLAAPALARERALRLTAAETSPAIRLYLPDDSGKLVEVVSPYDDPAVQDPEVIAKNAEILGDLFLKAGENVYVSKVTDDLMALDLYDEKGSSLARLEIDTLRVDSIQSNDKAGITFHREGDGDTWSISICLKASDNCYICIQINKHGKDRPVEFHMRIFCGSIDHMLNCDDIKRPWTCHWSW